MKTIVMQWTLIITNSLGPVKLLCYKYRNFVILFRVAKNNKIQKKKNFGTKKITLLYRDFVISVFFITRVHCTYIYMYVFKVFIFIVSHFLVGCCSHSRTAMPSLIAMRRFTIVVGDCGFHSTLFTKRLLTVNTMYYMKPQNPI